MKILWLVVLLVLPVCGWGQIITTIAGGGSGGDGGPATAASIFCPEDMAIDINGNLYFTEYLSHLIRKVDTSGIITTITGTGAAGFTGDNGPATSAQVNGPSGMTIDTLGNIFFCDQNNNRIRKIDAITGIITTIAGSSTAGYSGDGSAASSAKLNRPYDVFWDKNSGGLFIVDAVNYRVRKINTLGIITTVVGNGSTGSDGDGGPATAAACTPGCVTLDSYGNIYISDGASYSVRKTNIAGIISTIAGNSAGYIYNGDGISAIHAYIAPVYIAFDVNGILYVPDGYNDRVRKVDGSGIIHTIAGNGMPGFSGDGGPATAAKINNPSSVAFDQCGNLYIAQIDNPRIRKVTFYDHCFPASVESPNLANEINIYPNPANEILHIDGLTSQCSYRLLSIVGAVMQEDFLKEGSNSISIYSLPAGMYMVEVVSGAGERTVRKVMKQ